MNTERFFPPTAEAAAPRGIPAFEGLLALLAAWTVAYDLVALLRWPCWWMAILAIPLAATAWIAGVRLRRKTASGKGDSPILSDTETGTVPAAVVLMGLTVAAFTLLANRFDSDDSAYLRRVVVQMADLRSPVHVSNLTFDLDVPDVVPTQFLTSYEMLLGITARVLHCDLLTLYYNVLPAAIAFLVPLAYYLLFCAFGLDGKKAVLAVLGVLLFLILDGNVHRSPGNFAFVRLWQGKCILVTLGLPLVFLEAWRFLTRPNLANWYPLFLAGICGVGLSASGLFLVPGLLLVTSLAYVLGGRARNEERLAGRSRKAVLLISAAAYPLAVGLLLYAGVFPWARQALLVENNATWLAHLADFAIADLRSLVFFYAALLLIGPWLALPAASACVLTWLPILVLALFFTPLTGPLLFRVLTVTYFRLGYLCPVAMAAGLTFVALGQLPAMFRGLRTPDGARLGAGLRLAALAMIGVLLAFQSRQFTFAASNGVTWKSPLADRFPRSVRALARAVAPQLDGTVLLAPGDVASAVSLLNPKTRFAITEPYYYWSRYQREHEQRKQAQACVSRPSPLPGDVESLRQIARGPSISAIIVAPEADGQIVQTVLAQSGRPWRKTVEIDGFRLFLLREHGTSL